MFYEKETLFDSFQAEIYDPSNNDNGKDLWILFQVAIIEESFDAAALKDNIKHLHINLPCSESRRAGYLEIIANADNKKTCVYALKFESMIFQHEEFQADDIEEKVMTPHAMNSTNIG